MSRVITSTRHGADQLENTSSNTHSIVARVYFGRCLEMGLHITILYVLCSMTILQLVLLEAFSILEYNACSMMRVN
jgi:hypothetical protein